MDEPTIQEEKRSAWEELAFRIRSGDQALVSEFLKELEPAERSLAVSRLEGEEREALFVLLSAEEAAALLGSLPYVQVVEALGGMQPREAARILEEMPSSEQADVIGELDRLGADAILSEFPADEARELRSLCAYEDDEAGGLMLTEYLRFAEARTVGDVVEDLLENAEHYRGFDVQYVYVTGEGGRLTGVLSLRDLLLTPRWREIASIARRELLFVRDRDRLAELIHFFDEHRLFGAPVVDDDGRLLGVVRRSAVQEAHAEESERVYLQTQGIVGGEELRTMPLRIRSQRRLAWLSVNVLLNVAAASVIAMNQDTLQSVIALAVFLPIISDMSGCSGNQAVAVSMRELALGVVEPSELLRVWKKELSVGLLTGAALGVLLALAAWLYERNLWLSAVVGGAIAVNTLVAVSLGGMLPLILRRLGRDPALASGPILTTVTDMCGFLLALSFAAAVLPRLT